MKYDLWIDYHREDAEGLTHASVEDVIPGVELVPGSYVVVGNEEADSAVAKVVTVMVNGEVLESGSPEQIRKSAQVQVAYLGAEDEHHG